MRAVFVTVSQLARRLAVTKPSEKTLQGLVAAGELYAWNMQEYNVHAFTIRILDSRFALPCCSFHGLYIRQYKLCVYDIGISHWINGAIHVRDVFVGKTANHVNLVSAY